MEVMGRKSKQMMRLQAWKYWRLMHPMDNNNQIQHYCWVTNTTCAENDNWHIFLWRINVRIIYSGLCSYR